MASSSNRSGEACGSSYLSSLPVDVQHRYLEKTRTIKCDPYSLPCEEFGRDRMEWPEVTYEDVFDVYHYLVLSTSWYTKQQFKNYKSLEAYKLYQDGWIRDLLHKKINGYHLLKAKVTHSMRVAEKPLEPWGIIDSDGSVHSAHCTCMAGLGEACSHVAAVLFCLEACAHIRKEATPTDLPAYWIFPSSNRLDVQFQEVKYMNMQSAKRKRTAVSDTCTPVLLPDSVGISVVKTNVQHDAAPSKHTPTPEEEQDLFQKLYTVHPKSAVLSVVKGFAHNFTPKAATIGLPINLQSVIDSALDILDKDKIDEHCKKIDLNFSGEQASLLEKKTRGQSENSAWFIMRAGRITASNMYGILHTSLDNPSVSLLKKFFYPVQTKFTAAATRWGKKHEKNARKCYTQCQAKHHQKFSVLLSGLVLNPKYPAFGASPDGLVTCSCCSEGCLEIKCPYSLKDTHSKYEDLKWLLMRENDYFLQKSHDYFYQIQTQLHITERKYCDLAIWAPHLELLIIRIFPDADFWQATVEKANAFHQTCVMPQLCAQYFTKRKMTCTQNENQPPKNTFCLCQGSDDGRKMIQCESSTCQYVWFHVDCLQMKRVPKGKWICKMCKSLSK